MTHSRAHSTAFLAPDTPLSFSIGQHHLTPVVSRGESAALGGVPGELPFPGVSLLSKEVKEGCFLRGVWTKPGVSLKVPTGRAAEGQGHKRHVFEVPSTGLC